MLCIVISLRVHVGLRRQNVVYGLRVIPVMLYLVRRRFRFLKLTVCDFVYVVQKSIIKQLSLVATPTKCIPPPL